VTPKRTSSDRPEARTADESYELGTTEVSDQHPYIVEIAEFEDPLHHPQPVLFQVIDHESCVPEEATDPLNHLGRFGRFPTRVPGLELDDELASQCRGELS